MKESVFCGTNRTAVRRLFIVFFVVVGCGQSGWCAFKIGLNKGRSPISAISIASINHQGIVFSPALGRSDFIRYKWTEFSAEGLTELQRVLPRERVFQQKPGIDKVEYLQLISDELKKIAPPKPAAQNPAPVKPQPPPVKIAQVAPLISEPITPAPKPKNSSATEQPGTPKKQPESKPETEVETVPAFHLIQPAGITPSANHRPPESGLSFAAIFSPAGIFLVLVVMGFSVHAGNEIAHFRNRPQKLVCAISALFPEIGPTIFLLLPDPATKYADKMNEASDPFLIKRSDNPATIETEAPEQIPKVKYEEDLDSPYLNLNQGEEETHLEAESICTSTPKSEVIELYQAPEYQFGFEFFNQYFQRFVNSQPNDGQTLTLRTHGSEYPVHYITELSTDALNIIHPSGDEWLAETIEYGAIDEVEVTVSKT